MKEMAARNDVIKNREDATKADAIEAVTLCNCKCRRRGGTLRRRTWREECACVQVQMFMLAKPRSRLAAAEAFSCTEKKSAPDSSMDMGEQAATTVL